jgi:hypothetical protein
MGDWTKGATMPKSQNSMKRSGASELEAVSPWKKVFGGLPRKGVRKETENCLRDFRVKGIFLT